MNVHGKDQIAAMGHGRWGRTCAPLPQWSSPYSSFCKFSQAFRLNSTAAGFVASSTCSTTHLSASRIIDNLSQQFICGSYSEKRTRLNLYSYFIFGQHYKNWIFNANLGMNFATPAEGGDLEHNVVWDLEAETEIFENLTMFYEVFSAEDTIKQFQPPWNANSTSILMPLLPFYTQKKTKKIVRPGINVEF